MAQFRGSKVGQKFLKKCQKTTLFCRFWAFFGLFWPEKGVWPTLPTFFYYYYEKK
jgi:hypothetical protein